MDLIDSKKVNNDDEFILWHDSAEDGIQTDIYIEKSILKDLQKKNIIKIHAATGKIKGDTIGILFVKK